MRGYGGGKQRGSAVKMIHAARRGMVPPILLALRSFLMVASAAFMPVVMFGDDRGMPGHSHGAGKTAIEHEEITSRQSQRQ
jgi:hypothetical protein